MEIVTQTELVSINATMIIQVLSFLIFLFLIQRIMFRPLRDTMESRSADLKRLQKDIQASSRSSRSSPRKCRRRPPP